jgi:hypothetical protein
MTNIDIVFCRNLLGALRAEPAFRASGKRLMKDAWVYDFGRDHWEFHGPDDFYWHGSASNAYDARYKGWSAWLESKGVDMNAMEDAQ